MLKKLGAWPAVEQWSAPLRGRKDWTPVKGGGYVSNVRQSTQVQNYTTMVIQRDRLASALLQDVRARHGDRVSVTHGVKCNEVTWSGEWGSPWARATLTLEDAGSGRIEMKDYDLVVGADGVNSTLVQSLQEQSEGRCKMTRYEDRNARVYRTIPLDVSGTGWGAEYNYSFRSAEGPVLEALPTKEGLMIGLVLFEPSDRELAEVSTFEEADRLLTRLFPDLRPTMTDEAVKRFALQPVSKLPRFAVSGPELHSGTGVLVGDAVHTVKPYFGLGVNSAFEDVAVLGKCLDLAHEDVPAALQHYSRTHAKNAQALVRMSRQADGGFVQFVLPIILDSLFSKALPRVFSPSTIRMLQRADLSFSQVAGIKRRDRALQVALIAAALAVAAKAVQAALRSLLGFARVHWALPF